MLLFSKYSSACDTIIDEIQTLPQDILDNLNINLLCIDNSKIRRRIKSSKFSPILVPTILTIDQQGLVDKFEGLYAFNWVKQYKPQNISIKQKNKKVIKHTPVDDISEGEYEEPIKHEKIPKKKKKTRFDIEDFEDIMEIDKEKQFQTASGMSDITPDMQSIISSSIKLQSDLEKEKVNVTPIQINPVTEQKTDIDSMSLSGMLGERDVVINRDMEDPSGMGKGGTKSSKINVHSLADEMQKQRENYDKSLDPRNKF